MPARAPFTALCAALARPGRDRADLHVHTTHSDGQYSPNQIVELAQRTGLAALAITDHDTLTGIAPARAVAPPGVEIIAGVEISTSHAGRELHLLGYFVDITDRDLVRALAHLQGERSHRFWEMVARLRAAGLALDDAEVRAELPNLPESALGRRHLAQVLVQTRRAGSIREAFHRYLGDGKRVALPKVLLGVQEAIKLVRAAGGVASWAHPGSACTFAQVQSLHALGLGAIEVSYPTQRYNKNREMRHWATALGLAITGGSDCHGPDHARHAVGTCSITRAELESLRAKCRE